MLKNFITILLISLVTSNYGQEVEYNTKKFYMSAGYGFLLNTAKGPSPSGNNTTPNQSVNIAYGGYGFRYNLIDFNNEFSFGVSTMPLFAFGFQLNYDLAGFVNGNIPLYLEINKGLGATYNTEAEKGFFFGAGFDAEFVPLIRFPDGPYTGPNRAWILPSTEFGYRWWGKNYKVREIKLQMGAGRKQEIIDQQQTITYRPYSFKATFNILMGY